MSSTNSHNQVTEVSAITHELASAVSAGKAIVPFGQKRLPYNWQTGGQQIAFFDLEGYTAVEEYCPLDQVITVQCGIKLHALNQFLLENKQWLPVPSYDERTSLLDLILTGNAGPMEIFSGGLRRHVLGLTFLLSNGHCAKSGGKVVKNVSGYDLTRFLIGSYGQFALPISANLRLYSIPEQTRTIFVASKDIELLFNASKSMQSSGISLRCVELLDKRLLSEDLIDLVSKKMKTVDGQNYCLFAKIYGDENTVEAETALAKKILNEFGLECVLFAEDSEQDRFLTGLSNIDGCLSAKSEFQHIVEVALSNGNFRKICQNKDLVSFPFLYRAGSDRLIYCLDSPSAQNVLLDQLGKYAKKEGKALTVAYSDNSFMKKVQTLGDIADGADALKTIRHALKKQFDPHNLFNPFVDL